MKTLLDVLPKGRKKILDTGYHKMPHFTYSPEDLGSVKVQHVEPQTIKEQIAYRSIKFIRWSYDTLTRYHPQEMTEAKWIQRCLILETTAGVPGMVAGMVRHLQSIRTMKRDGGWIHHLMEEADNERFHLFIFLHLKQPGLIERMCILAMQGIFCNYFFLSYLLTPKFSHRFVGYLEEEAVKTYTGMLEAIDSPQGCLYHWNSIPATPEAIDYYTLPEDATLRDVISCIRADEAVHRETNHFLASIDQNEELEEEELEVINKKRRKLDPIKK